MKTLVCLSVFTLFWVQLSKSDSDRTADEEHQRVLKEKKPVTGDEILLFLADPKLDKLQKGRLLLEIRRQVKTWIPIAMNETTFQVSRMKKTFNIRPNGSRFIDSILTHILLCKNLTLTVHKPLMKSILATSSADLFGEFLHRYIIPLAKWLYYEGDLTVNDTQRVFTVYNGIKQEVLDSDFVTATMDKAKNNSELKLLCRWGPSVPIQLPFKLFHIPQPSTVSWSGSCWQVLPREKPRRGVSDLKIQMPQLDNPLNPNSIFFINSAGRYRREYSLQSDYVTKLLQTFFVCNVLEWQWSWGREADHIEGYFKNYFLLWMHDEILPLLHHSAWYRGLHGILRLYTLVCNRTVTWMDDEIKASKQHDRPFQKNNITFPHSSSSAKKFTVSNEELASSCHCNNQPDHTIMDALGLLVVISVLVILGVLSVAVILSYQARSSASAIESNYVSLVKSHSAERLVPSSTKVKMSASLPDLQNHQRTAADAAAWEHFRHSPREDNLMKYPLVKPETCDDTSNFHTLSFCRHGPREDNLMMQQAIKPGPDSSKIQASVSLPQLSDNKSNSGDDEHQDSRIGSFLLSTPQPFNNDHYSLVPSGLILSDSQSVGGETYLFLGEHQQQKPRPRH